MADDQQINKLLRENLEVAQRSLRILEKMHRAQRIGYFVKIFKWLLLAALAFGLYYYIQPFVMTLFDSLQRLKDTTTNLPPGLLEDMQKLLGE
jgi:ABC-type glycerol-3-phosphate transport system permease component